MAHTKYADIPKSVADADRDADALLDALETGEVPSPEVPAPTPEEVVVEEVVIETPVDDPPKPATPDLEKEIEKANHRYSTLEGMMRANAARSAQIIEDLKEQVAANKVAVVEAPLEISDILTEDEQAEFGEGGVKVLEKLARAISAKEIGKATLEVEQKLEEMRKRVDAAEASADGNSTWDLVEKVNPGAKAINGSDMGWFEFLATVDPISGRAYRELGEAASGVNDIQRLSELIDTYRLSANLAKPKVPVKPNQAPVALKKNDGNLLTEKRKYSQDEIREFYDHRARGLLKGITAGLDAKKLQALEDDIEAAMEDGRVIL